jgi:hypothetical protein
LRAHVFQRSTFAVEKLAPYDRLAKKSQAAPVAKAKKSDEKNSNQAREPVAKAA